MRKGIWNKITNEIIGRLPEESGEIAIRTIIKMDQTYSVSNIRGFIHKMAKDNNWNSTGYLPSILIFDDPFKHRMVFRKNI